MTPEEQAAADAAQKAAEAAAAKARTYSEEEFKEVVAARDTAKAKLREREEAEKKAQDAKLLEEGKVKELLEKAMKRIADLEPLETEIKSFREAEAARKEALLKELPKEKRELYQTASEAVIRDAVDMFKAANGEPPTHPRKVGSQTDGKKYEDYTQPEILQLQAENPPLYKTLYGDWYKRKYGREAPAQYLK